MDKFLDHIREEGEAESAGNFTLSGENTRRKLLESAPLEHPEAKLLLLFDALVKGGYEPDKDLKLRIFKQTYRYDVRKITVTLRGGTLNSPMSLFQALKEPFQNPTPEYTQFTRFAYWTAGQGFSVTIKWRSGSLSFQKTELVANGELLEEAPSVTLEVKLPDGHLSHELSSYCRGLASMLRAPLQVMPEEAFTTPYTYSEFFKYRSKPFTLLKRFVQTEQQPSLRIDLWESPFTELRHNLLLMDRKKPGNWLFRLWRPNYGRPSFLIEFSDNQSFGKLPCRAVFWIELTEQDASISFSKGDFFRNFLPIKGPPGLRGYVLWPELVTDTWGWDLIRDENYRQAVDWCEEQAAEMASTLREHWVSVYHAALNYRLISHTSYYMKEVKDRMQVLWGS